MIKPLDGKNLTLKLLIEVEKISTSGSKKYAKIISRNNPGKIAYH